MPKFPVDAPKSKVLKALGQLGFALVREREHISMIHLLASPVFPCGGCAKDYDADMPRRETVHGEAES